VGATGQQYAKQRGPRAHRNKLFSFFTQIEHHLLFGRIRAYWQDFIFLRIRCGVASLFFLLFILKLACRQILRNKRGPKKEILKDKEWEKAKKTVNT